MSGPPKVAVPLAPSPPVSRRLFHAAAGSSIPTIAVFVDSSVMVAMLAVLLGLALAIETARFRMPGMNSFLVGVLRPLLKEAETQRITGATYIAFSALVVFIAFDKPIAIAALFFLALGDPVAALIGSRARGLRIWNKSPVGTLAFAAAAVAIGGVLAAGGVVDFTWALVGGAAVATVVELVPTLLDDNVTIPLISGMSMWLMGA